MNGSMITIELKDPILEFIWSCFQMGGTFTAQDVMNETGLPYTTVVHRILRYESQGILTNEGTKEEAVGRPRNMWGVNGEKFQDIIGRVIN